MTKAKRTFSLSFKFSVVMMLMALVIGALIIVFGYQIYNQQIIDKYTLEGQANIEASQQVVDGDTIARYADTLEEDEEYWQITADLRLIARAGDATYIYVLKPVDGGGVFIFDSDETSGRISLGTWADWEHSFSSYIPQAEEGGAIPPTITNDEYGWLLSVFQPMYDSSNEFVGYLGVDLSAAELVQERQEFMSSLIVTTIAVAIAVTLVFVLIFRFLVLRPVNKIADAANTYLVDSSESPSAANSITGLHISTHDELQSLSESLKTMEGKIQEYIKSLEETNLKAETDSMTGLLNREAFEKRVKAALSAGTFDGCYAFMMIDLDNFKDINDSFGHTVGDQVIIEAVKAIRSRFRPNDLIARMGGDEFAVFFTSAKKGDLIRKRAESINEAVKALKIEDGLSLTVSIGVAMAGGQESHHYQTLYIEADDALYSTKDAGRDGFTIHEL